MTRVDSSSAAAAPPPSSPSKKSSLRIPGSLTSSISPPTPVCPASSTRTRTSFCRATRRPRSTTSRCSWSRRPYRALRAAAAARIALDHGFTTAARPRNRGRGLHGRRPQEGVRPRHRARAARLRRGPRDDADGPAIRSSASRGSGRCPTASSSATAPTTAARPSASRRSTASTGSRSTRTAVVLPDAGRRLGLDPELHAGRDERDRGRGAPPAGRRSPRTR